MTERKLELHSLDYPCLRLVKAKRLMMKYVLIHEAFMESQDSFIMRELHDAEVDLGEDREEALADVGNNADLYAANQVSTELINEVPTEKAPLRFMDQDV